MFALELDNKGSSSTSAPKTYTNFKSSQDKQPEFTKNLIHPKYPDITIARIGPGQVNLLCFAFYIFLLSIIANLLLKFEYSTCH